MSLFEFLNEPYLAKMEICGYPSITADLVTLAWFFDTIPPCDMDRRTRIWPIASTSAVHNKLYVGRLVQAAVCTHLSM